MEWIITIVIIIILAVLIEFASLPKATNNDYRESIRLLTLSKAESRGIQWALCELATATKHDDIKALVLKRYIKEKQVEIDLNNKL